MQRMGELTRLAKFATLLLIYLRIGRSLTAVLILVRAEADGFDK